MNTDWKEALLAQSRAMGIEPDGTENVESNEAGAVEDIQRAPLHIAIEKKGRGGKTATIIEGFTCSEERLKSIASDMKNALGTGGSARGGAFARLQSKITIPVLRLCCYNGHRQVRVKHSHLPRHIYACLYQNVAKTDVMCCAVRAKYGTNTPIS